MRKLISKHQLSLFREDQPDFDGETYEPEQDKERLSKQLDLVWSIVEDGYWYTLESIRKNIKRRYDVRIETQSISARLRDLRKDKFGGHTVERKNKGGGLFVYRLIPNKKSHAN